MVICGKAFVQNGGHSDYRSRYEMGGGEHQDNQFGSVARVVDGVGEMSTHSSRRGSQKGEAH
jgi:hypothetical protein